MYVSLPVSVCVHVCVCAGHACASAGLSKLLIEQAKKPLSIFDVRSNLISIGPQAASAVADEAPK